MQMQLKSDNNNNKITEVSQKAQIQSKITAASQSSQIQLGGR